MEDVSSSSPEFFDIRYAAGRMPWDYGGVPNSLKVFLDEHRGPGRVLIPGCGSGYEIEAFSSGGWDVIGIDFSKVGVARARRLLGPLADKVCEGDFFTYPLRERSFDIIYERTFLCALLPDDRPRYARRIATLLAPSGILCGFFFLGPEEEPPPYPISQDQLDGLLGHSFEKIEDSAVEDSLPLYAGKERWQIWKRKITDSLGCGSNPVGVGSTLWEAAFSWQPVWHLPSRYQSTSLTASTWIRIRWRRLTSFR